ncbi:MAG: hypothetical protein Q9191_002578 [Dirinaria sp. TL-2023a]
MPSSKSIGRLRFLSKVFGAALALCLGLRQFSVFFLHKNNNNNNPSSIPQLREAQTAIPAKIWQTWYTSAVGLGEQEKHRTLSWLDKNPRYQYELVTDQAAESLVERHYFHGNDLLLAETFLALNDTILKADFLRYLIILAEGGLYTDIDVECYQPIDEWLPLDLREKAAVIVGIEADRQPVEKDLTLYYDRRKHIWGINNWTFMAKRGHPFLRRVAETVARNLRALAEQQGTSLAAIDVSYKQVIDTTGPRAFTAAFLQHASQATGKKFTSADATMLDRPMVVGDIVILPIRAMSTAEADRADGDGARSNSWPAVLFHHSVGSWKKTHFAKPDPTSDSPG